MRWLTIVTLAGLLGSATVADAQVFKPRGKGAKAGKAKTPAASTAKKQTRSTTTASKSRGTAAKSSPKKAGKSSKVAAARPSDLTPDPVDADTDYVVIEDIDE